MTNKILEHDKAKKFKRKHKTDKQLILRIEKKYIEIIKNPYKPSFLEMKSDNVQNVEEQELEITE